MSPEERRVEYAATLLEHTAGIVAAVRGDGPDELLDRIEEALHLPAPAGTDPLVALVTILAAQVPVDATHRQLLAWTAQLRGPVRMWRQLTEPELAAMGVPLGADGADARRARVAELADRGLAVVAIAERIGTSTRTVHRILAERRAAAEASAVAS